jgi:hypothetical protein
VLVGPRSEVVRTPTSAREVVRTRRAFSFMNVAGRTTYVVLARPAAGRWRVRPEGGSVLTAVRSAALMAPPSVSARVTGSGRQRRLAYRVRPRRHQRVTFYERGRGVQRRIGTVRGGGRGVFAFRPVDARGRARRVEAVFEQRRLPRARVVAASFTAPPVRRAGRPSVAIRRIGAAAEVRWLRSARSDRYGVRVAVGDGRRLFFLRGRTGRAVRVSGVRGRTLSARVVGLRTGVGAGNAGVARSRPGRAGQ